MHAVNAIDALCTIEQNLYVLACTQLCLQQRLPAGATRSDRSWREVAISVACSDAEPSDRGVWVTRIGIEHAGTFSTKARWVGGILLIAARQDGTIGQ